MGNAASEELDKWASVSDLALYSRRMKVIPALPAECQVEALRIIWRSLRWVPRNTELLGPHEPLDRLFLVVRGELQAVLAKSRYMPLLPEGSFLCEAALLRGEAKEKEGEVRDFMWPLRRWGRIPNGPLDLIQEYLYPMTTWAGPRFHGRIRATERSLIGELTRQEFLWVLKKAEDPAAVHALFQLDMPTGIDGERSANGSIATRVACNTLQNVTAFGAQAQELGAQEIAALRIVCEGPMNISCQNAIAPVMRSVQGGLFGACTRPEVESSQEFRR